MNRLIIVGNGFDLAHGLETSYSSFVKWYLTKYIEKSLKGSVDTPCLSFHSIEHEDIRKFLSNRIGNCNTDTIAAELIKKRAIVLADDIQLKIKFGILYSSVAQMFGKGWADIEKEYYTILTKNYKDWKRGYDSDARNKEFEKLLALHQELEHIKEELEEYVEERSTKCYGKSSFLSERRAYAGFEENDFNPQVWSKYLKESEIPEDLMILNFNYTTPFNNRINQRRVDVVNIHGVLKSRNNPLVFGYGDELDEEYLEIEKDGENEWLRNIKSFSYLQNKEYDLLQGFIEKSEFQVYIVGHSCGLSDKTLLNQIFTNGNCKSIKVFYHTKKDGTDDFNEIIYNISRTMKDKVKMREIVCKKEACFDFNHIYGLATNN